jgi:hypothetical protein
VTLNPDAWIVIGFLALVVVLTVVRLRRNGRQ